MHPRVLKRCEHPISRRHIDVVALKVLYRLIDAGFVAYLVGGAVRDLMLGRRPKDFDVGTTAHPEQVRALFRNSRLIGRRFPLVHVFFHGGRIVEVATFRAEPESVEAEDKATAVPSDVNFGTPEQDAFRRDFTVNALFYDPKSFHVLDYIGGLEDLKRRLVRTVGDAERRIREDPVRMVRAVRLAAKLGFELDLGLRVAITTCRAELLRAAPARLAEEIYRVLACEGSARAIQLMQELGLLEVLFPDCWQILGHRPLAWERAARNLEALEGARQRGVEISRAMMLSALFAELGLGETVPLDTYSHLARELRSRGFARTEAARVRLLLGALSRLRARRRLQRLVRLPYYAEVRQLYQLVALNYGLETSPPSESDQKSLATAPHIARLERRTRRRRRLRKRTTLQATGGVENAEVSASLRPSSEDGSPGVVLLLPPR